MSTKPLTYADAGVNLKSWNKTKERIGSLVKSTFNSNAVGIFGQFGGLFDISMLKDYDTPILVSSVDGVGTKLLIAHKINKHDSVGEDIVNHCVNDILVMGAKPLYFLDYIGVGSLFPELVEQIMKGLASACKKTGIVLIGGETAEMPDLYKNGEYDLTGTIVGIVDKSEIIDGSDILPGDIIIGLRSNGLHTNGYSLARRIITGISKKNYSDIFEESGNTFGEELLKPHRAYIGLFPFFQKKIIKGATHITGGGFQENIDRILPDKCSAVIETKAWKPDPVFAFLQKNGGVENDEMYRTFNMGVGMTLILREKDAQEIIESETLVEYNPVAIGRIVDGNGQVVMEY
ncbi:MAG: phosphoribosylformylglycinamidine cyclo-ligase [Chitinispirillia bacterium]|jgi:phosphoribosylformylglycinamidine cyclo-ligase